MAIASLNIEEKDNNPAAPGSSSTSHKLGALEFNQLVAKVNELVAHANKTVYLTQEEYDSLVENDGVEDDVEYNIIEG